MAIKFERIKAGDVLYDCRREGMGNTTMSRWACWPVKIISVDPSTRTAMVRWNSNAPQKYYGYQLVRLSRTEPKVYRDQQERRRKGWL
jgi:hypothetical protein